VEALLSKKGEKASKWCRVKQKSGLVFFIGIRSRGGASTFARETLSRKGLFGSGLIIVHK
jgi:hypothetical protein